MLKNSVKDTTPKAENFLPLFGPGDVPGYLTDEDISAITSLCEMLPNTGTLVEIGSFLGKSSVEWSKNLTTMNKDFTIICIDSFNSPVEVLNQLLIEADFEIPAGVTNNIEMFKHYTKNYKNIFSVTGFFDKKFVFPQMIDGVFEDSDHSMEYLSYALPFWWEHIKPRGILSGHDYGNEVQTAVDIFAAINKLEVKTFKNGSSIWYLEKK